MNEMLQAAYDSGFVDGALAGGGVIFAGVLVGQAVVWVILRRRDGW